MRATASQEALSAGCRAGPQPWSPGSRTACEALSLDVAPRDRTARLKILGRTGHHSGAPARAARNGPGPRPAGVRRDSNSCSARPGSPYWAVTASGFRDHATVPVRLFNPGPAVGVCVVLADGRRTARLGVLLSESPPRLAAVPLALQATLSRGLCAPHCINTRAAIQ